MRQILRTALPLILVAAGRADAGPPLPPTPAPVQAVLYAREFELGAAFPYDWRHERPPVSRGVLLVLQVDPDLVYPRQTAEPVLYVGDQTAMRLNVGYPSGRVVALVPGDAPLDPAGTLVFFGTPRLPESVTKETIAGERARAVAAGIAPLPRAQFAAAIARGGTRARHPTLNALLHDAAALVRTYAPDEADRAAGLAAQRE